VHSVRRGIWTRQGKELAQLAKEEGEELESVELGELSLYDLLRAMSGVLNRYDKEHPPPLLLHTEIFSVRDQLLRLVKRLEGGRPFDVLDDLRALSCRAEAVAAFLAVLEMAKLSLIRLHQTDAGAILLYRTATELDAAAIEGLQ
jgi:chromatin segregation and condensation protein Rec8/ScpA/Scc1 (kleisin family)